MCPTVPRNTVMRDRYDLFKLGKHAISFISRKTLRCRLSSLSIVLASNRADLLDSLCFGEWQGLKGM